MISDHEKAVAFITGASRGIGYAVARHLAPTCSHLLIASKTKEAITAAAVHREEKSACKVHPIWGDLVQGRCFADAAKQLVTTTTKRLDILVLDAGYYVEGSLAENRRRRLRAKHARELSFRSLPRISPVAFPKRVSGRENRHHRVNSGLRSVSACPDIRNCQVGLARLCSIPSAKN